jgi:xylulokinase
MTTKQYLMGIDIGTQSTRAAVLDLDGRVVTSASCPQDMLTPRPGWAEQNPQVWWDTTTKNIIRVFEGGKVSPAQILAVGVSGQMHGSVPVGRDGELLADRVQLWCDKRAAGLVEAFSARSETAEAYRITGSPPVSSWLGFKILWEKTHRSRVYKRAWKFLLPKDYINYRLTGTAATDHSEASGAFLMDVETETWSQELAGLLGLEISKLPDIYPSSDVIGTVTAAAAAATGLLEGTPVVAGGGDMLCMLLAAGITRPGIASDVTGTSGIFSVFTDKPVLDPRLMNLHHVMPGWIPFGIIDSGGGALKWFKDSFCQAEILRAKQQGGEVYGLLNEMAVLIDPGAEGLLFYPYLMGERTLGTPYARGVFFGLTPRTGKGAMVRAIMEGITFELRRTLEIVEAAGYPVEVVYHNGGGARSGLWNQIKADIYQKTVQTFESSEGGILGSAILAGVGAGVYPDPASGAARCLRVANEYHPRPETRERYDALFTLYKELHDRLQVPYNTLAAIL